MSAQTAPKKVVPPQSDVQESWDSDASSDSDEESSVSDDKTEDSDVDSDVDPEATSDEDKVLHSYKRLLSRRVDLV